MQMYGNRSKGELYTIVDQFFSDRARAGSTKRCLAEGPHRKSGAEIALATGAGDTLSFTVWTHDLKSCSMAGSLRTEEEEEDGVEFVRPLVSLSRRAFLRHSVMRWPRRLQ